MILLRNLLGNLKPGRSVDGSEIRRENRLVERKFPGHGQSLPSPTEGGRKGTEHHPRGTAPVSYSIGTSSIIVPGWWGPDAFDSENVETCLKRANKHSLQLWPGSGAVIGAVPGMYNTL